MMFLFRSFKEKEFTPCVCKVDKDNPGNALKLSGLERHLVGEGSHCRLLTSIRMDMQDGSKDQRLMESCEIIIIERPPSGVFADQFELQHLHELGGKLGEDLNFTVLWALSKSGYWSVQFGECDVLVRRSPKSNLQRNPCLSIFTTGAADKPAIGRLVWIVPSGIETHAGFVSSFTFLSAALASITIISHPYFVRANDVVTLKGF